MKKALLILFLIVSTVTFSQVTIAPAAFEVDQSITITVDINSSATDCNGLSNPSKVYMHSGIGDDANPWNSTIGNWGADDGIGEMTNNGDGTWSITLTPKTYYGLSDTEAANATKMGMVFRNADGSKELKKTGCNDFFFKVGSFQLSLTNPTQELSVLTSGQSLLITATTTLAADFVLKANGVTINTSSNSTTYSYTHTNITENTNYILEATNNGDTKSSSFQVIVSINEAPVPTGMEDGINLNPADPTKATLVLFAPGKEVVHLIGDFNNWEIDNNYLLNKDSSNNRFWIELTNLTAQTNHIYQYVVDGSIKIADPYSTTILAENDQYINNITFPNLPAYPSGLTNHAVTLLRTGDTPFNWQTTDYTAPSKDNLVIYELLIRDFDELHSFDAVKARLDYIEGLGVNAIELMPVSEFDGNESWGYNPSFHMALDKYYGTPTAFKQFIDECHNRGIAVILDVVYNHATGQNPFYRMWNTDNGGYGGQARSDSPFFNPVATHTYSVFNDFNHSEQATKDYVKRTSQYWIEEYKIDGFRWDLTKGFTQNCTSTDEACTGTYQQDRVDVLKEYADYQWDKNSDFYVIFEHLGGNTEETVWADYGIMLWGNVNHNYNQNTMGYSSESDISRVSYKSRSWSAPNLVGYMESHDEERLMYKNLEYGNSNSDYNVKNLNTALSRQETAGLFFLTIPGPKMIWQFGELGYDYSINACPDGTISDDCRVANKPIEWGYENNPNRKHIYNTWATLTAFKKQYPEVFNTADFDLNVGNTSTKSIVLKDASMDVVIIGNFDIVDKTVSTTFTKTGDWYEYFTGEVKNVTTTSESISLKPGEYKMYSTTKLLDPRGGTASDDSDNDGVVDTEDLCPNTMEGITVDATGCPKFTIASNNFEIEVIGETCPNKNNGQIIINAQETLNYTTSEIDGNTYTFNNDKTIENLPDGTYSFCITVDGESYEQCYSVTIEAGVSLLAKASTKSSKMSIDIDKGTAPFNVSVNGKQIFKTFETSFTVNANHGDLVEVTSNVICEGTFSKEMDLVNSITAYPNPTNGQFEITLPTDKKEVIIELYNTQSQLISAKSYPINYGKVQLNIADKPRGLYIAKIILNKPIALKIIKQ